MVEMSKFRNNSSLMRNVDVTRKSSLPGQPSHVRKILDFIRPEPHHDRIRSDKQTERAYVRERGNHPEGTQTPTTAGARAPMIAKGKSLWTSH